MIRKYILHIIFLLAVMLLLAMRLFSPANFSPDAEKNALPAIREKNLMDLKMPIPDDALILVIQHEEKDLPFQHNKIIRLSPEDIFQQATIQTLRKNQGSIIVYSDNLQTSATAWMLLAQKGIKDHLLLIEEMNVESFKHQFLPDTTWYGKESEMLLDQ